MPDGLADTRIADGHLARQILERAGVDSHGLRARKSHANAEDTRCQFHGVAMTIGLSLTPVDSKPLAATDAPAAFKDRHL